MPTNRTPKSKPDDPRWFRLLMELIRVSPRFLQVLLMFWWHPM